jgi:spermidine synthase
VRKTLRFYDGIAHQGLFFLPKYLREELQKEKRVITEQEPLFI